jgi:predicted DCC family thiol-disulfide oxidoreductase YuxK
MKLPEKLQNQYASLILFDGVCNLCNALVAFVIRRDPLRQFRFASLQGKTGQLILAGLNFPATELNTMIYVRGDRYYLRSEAALEIFRRLTGPWRLMFVFKVVPVFIRDFFYGILAGNRYRWFGKKEACLIPTPELKSSFLE